MLENIMIKTLMGFIKNMEYAVFTWILISLEMFFVFGDLCLAMVLVVPTIVIFGSIFYLLKKGYVFGSEDEEEE